MSICWRQQVRTGQFASGIWRSSSRWAAWRETPRRPGPFSSVLMVAACFCGGRDSLRVYGWEPERCFDTIPVLWGKVSDLSICNNQLIGVSHFQSNVSSFVVDLNRVKMTGSGSLGSLPKETPVSQPAPTGSSLRRNYERPSTHLHKAKK
ncbi:unnamed protein product, partial [Ranitomeya imitator]